MNKLFPNKPRKYLIHYGWQEIQATHELMAHNKKEAKQLFKKVYGTGFDYIEVERW